MPHGHPRIVLHTKTHRESHTYEKESISALAISFSHFRSLGGNLLEVEGLGVSQVLVGKLRQRTPAARVLHANPRQGGVKVVTPVHEPRASLDPIQITQRENRNRRKEKKKRETLIQTGFKKKKKKKKKKEKEKV